MHTILMNSNINRRQFVGAAALAATSLPWGFLRSSVPGLPMEGYMPFFHGASGWLNSQPLSDDAFRGKVVLVDFWTYSCINWRRSLPYVRAWAKKYRKHGLIVVGVHSPEFQFERDIENVRRAAQTMMIDYPVAIDNDYAVWRAFNNEFWPALYIADKNGRIRHHQFGEGGYEQSERVIQQLLREAGANSFDPDLEPVDATGPEAAADWPHLRSNENYLGFDRTERFSSSGGFHEDKPHAYKSPGELKLNHWALEGEWAARKQSVRSLNAGGRIDYRFHARDLHVVMGAVLQERPIRFRVLLDGQAPVIAHGVDIDAQGFGVAQEPRLYQLIRQERLIEDRRFSIEFLDEGIEAYSFTFG